MEVQLGSMIADVEQLATDVFVVSTEVNCELPSMTSNPAFSHVCQQPLRSYKVAMVIWALIHDRHCCIAVLHQHTALLHQRVCKQP